MFFKIHRSHRQSISGAKSFFNLYNITLIVFFASIKNFFLPETIKIFAKKPPGGYIIGFTIPKGRYLI